MLMNENENTIKTFSFSGAGVRFHLTSGLREVQFPRKNSPRETELRIFSELKLNLGVVRCNRTKPFKPC